eukprot:CAMPEP_0117692188 /NCGR_PEP_ID=MMETSP0804-20121206/26179_1 /TAXON_ID=1074897 /ORGANISM="Tetraselmis astigmatica, Strain CCMP880" /LENGTH=57 /DNA_ID=CAMNT_0005505589 /DNA_START=124 /DNA_END=293 /DNA_ORIENTATION=-
MSRESNLKVDATHSVPMYVLRWSSVQGPRAKTDISVDQMTAYRVVYQQGCCGGPQHA